MADGSCQTVVLGHGFELDCSFPSVDSVSVRIRFHRLRLWSLLFDADAGLRNHRVNLGLIEIGLAFEGDMFRGEVVWRLRLAVRSIPNRPWRSLLSTGDRVLLRFDPCLGEVAGKTAVHLPEVDDPVFGESQTCTPTVLRLHVEDGQRDLCGVGRIVKERMFPDHPPFVFNTVACVGAFPPGRPGPYTDPRSIWFNIFLGYYQLDCAKSEWARPFGYATAQGVASQPEAEDLARLGKSDWNWFSNWNYGVPTADLLPYSTIDMNGIGFADKGVVAIGSSRWHELELSRVDVASCYVADDGSLVTNTIIDSFWRLGFGGPSPLPSRWPRSFIPTVVDAVVDMAYWEDDAAYHTVLFGGTAVQGSDPRFLATQLAATKAVIATHYPDLGFA